jgi:hypothetical protein
LKFKTGLLLALDHRLDGVGYVGWGKAKVADTVQAVVQRKK